MPSRTHPPGPRGLRANPTLRRPDLWKQTAEGLALTDFDPSRRDAWTILDHAVAERGCPIRREFDARLHHRSQKYCLPAYPTHRSGSRHIADRRTHAEPPRRVRRESHRASTLREDIHATPPARPIQLMPTSHPSGTGHPTFG